MATNTNNQSYLNKSRKDKFLLVFSLPDAMKKIDSKTARTSFNVNQDAMQFSVFGAVVPEIVVPAIQIGYGGSNLYNSSHARDPYPPVTVDFTIDNGFNNYWTMYKWLDLMHDDKEGLYDTDDLSKDELFSSYQTDITLYGLDEYDNKRIEWKYTKAFPTNLGSIDYSYRDESEAVSSMTFVYSQVHSKLISQ
tara:strand:+ start:2735 stop:3313 length:579 start_codon:yes stop_codon:yes gene_type:complete